MASLFVYKMYVLPNLTEKHYDKIKKMFNNFLWSGRRPKIPIEKLCNMVQLGGLKLVDMRVKELSLKASWIVYIKDDAFTAECCYECLDKTLRESIWYCNIKRRDIERIFTDSFWRDVLSAWSEINFKNSVNTEQEVLAQHLWYNSHIRVNDKCIFYKQAFKNGLVHVAQLYTCDGEIMPLKIMRQMFEITIMEYNSLITALPKEWKLKLKNKGNMIKDEKYLYETFIQSAKPAAVYYNMSIAKESQQFNTYVRWQVRLKTGLSYKEFLKLYTNLRKCTNVSKLRSFQYRLLNLSISLNVQLKKWKVIDNEACSNCSNEKETLEHFFYDCETAKLMRESIEEFIYDTRKSVKKI